VKDLMLRSEWNPFTHEH